LPLLLMAAYLAPWPLYYLWWCWLYYMMLPMTYYSRPPGLLAVALDLAAVR